MNSFQYTARESDTETGLYYYRARYYDLKVGRFLSEDTIRFNDTRNFYRYVRNSPPNLVDPSGEVIGVTPGSGAAGYLAFYTALLNLSQSPDAAAIIQELEQSPDLYLVGVSDSE